MYPKNMDEPKTVDVGDLLKGVKEGEGGEVAGFKLATQWRTKELSEKETLRKIEKWNRLNEPPLAEDELKPLIDSAYTPEEPYGYVFTMETKEVFTEEII